MEGIIEKVATLENGSNLSIKKWCRVTLTTNTSKYFHITNPTENVYKNIILLQTLLVVLQCPLPAYITINSSLGST